MSYIHTLASCLHLEPLNHKVQTLFVSWEEFFPFLFDTTFSFTLSLKDLDLVLKSIHRWGIF